eukprot:TRINITY_DN5849_c2_g1_i1.p1 TRINITY_DN5849_c2_g1~~TRINITY_DN5849_c2_g1_i1.p1  ORF type:complete len:565 (+),score=175.54 TRINITY_DN5849_c2_g1_i1:106-1695(+)
MPMGAIGSPAAFAVLGACVWPLSAEAGPSGLTDFLYCNVTDIASRGFHSLNGTEPCEYGRYFEDTVISLMPLVVLAGLILLACPVTYVSRYFLRCCGGSEAAPDSLCIVKEYSVNPLSAYTPEHIRRAKLATCPLLVACLAGLALVIVADSQAHKAEGKFFDGRRALPNDLVIRTQDFQECMGGRPAPFMGNTSDYDYDTFASAEDDFEVEYDKMQHSHEYRNIHFLVKGCTSLGLVPVVFMLLAVAMAYCTCYGIRTNLLMGVFFFIASMTCMLIAFTGIGMSYISDGRSDYNSASNTSLYNTYWEYECESGTFTGLHQEVDAVSRAHRSTERDLRTGCRTLWTACRSSQFTCNIGDDWDSLCKADNVTEIYTRMAGAVNSTSIVAAACAPGLPCSVNECLMKCKDGSADREVSLQVALGVVDFPQLEICTASWGIGSCPAYLSQSYLPFLEDSADAADVAAALFLSASTLQLLALLCGIPVLAHGTKAFRDGNDLTGFGMSPLVDENEWMPANNGAINAQGEMNIVS